MATKTLRGLNTRASRTAALTLAVSAIITPITAHAGDVYSKAGPRDWNVPTDWIGDSIPLSTDFAVIGDTSQATPVDMYNDDTRSAATLRVGFNAGTGALTLYGNASLTITGQTNIGELGGFGTMNVQAGSFSTNNLFINAFGGSGVFNQSGGSVNVAGSTIVGYIASGGQLNLTGGSYTTQDLVFGVSGTSNGSMTINSAATLNITRDLAVNANNLTHDSAVNNYSVGRHLNIADEGNRTTSFTQTGTGTFTVGGDVNVGLSFPTNGTYNLQQGTLSANNLSVGVYGNGTMNISAGTTTTIASTIVVSNQFETGIVNQNGGSVTSGSGDVIVGNLSTGTWNLNTGTLSSGRDIVLGAVTVYNGIGGTVNQAAGTSASAAQDLIIARGNGSISTPATYNQAGGTVSVIRDVTLGETAAATGTYNMNGGSLTVDKGTSTVTVGKVGSGTFNFGNSTTGGTLTESGSGAGVNLTVRETSGATGVVQGWGTAGHTGTITNNGRVIANGFGTARNLNMSSYAQDVENTIQNAPSGTFGWYATGKGRLTLPSHTVSAGSSTITWGEDDADGTIDLVNSTRLAYSGSTGGTSTSALLSLDRAEIPSGLAGIIDVWDYVDSLSYTSLAMQARYDHTLIDPSVGEANYGLWVFNGSSWLNITTGIDVTNNIVSGSTTTENFGFYAVAPVPIPEPTSVGLIAMTAAGLLRRRRGV